MIEVKRVLVQGHLTPLKVVTRFVWTRIGPDITLDVGHFDAVEFRAAALKAEENPDETVEVNLYVTDRLALGLTGAQSFIESAELLRRDLSAHGIEMPAVEAPPPQEDSDV